MKPQYLGRKVVAIIILYPCMIVCDIWDWVKRKFFAPFANKLMNWADGESDG